MLLARYCPSPHSLQVVSALPVSLPYFPASQETHNACPGVLCVNPCGHNSQVVTVSLNVIDFFPAAQGSQSPASVLTFPAGQVWQYFLSRVLNCPDTHWSQPNTLSCFPINLPLSLLNVPDGQSLHATSSESPWSWYLPAGQMTQDVVGLVY